MISRAQRKEINYRSGKMCEAMVLTGAIWTRCWKSPVEIHHLLTRARGGHILDYVDEVYHLIALCKQHHRDADSGEGFAGGLMIDGYVLWKHNKPYYQGTDIYLKETYGSP
jgi:hypothetical protein